MESNKKRIDKGMKRDNLGRPKRKDAFVGGRLHKTPLGAVELPDYEVDPNLYALQKEIRKALAQKNRRLSAEERLRYERRIADAVKSALQRLDYQRAENERMIEDLDGFWQGLYNKRAPGEVLKLESDLEIVKAALEALGLEGEEQYD